MGERIYNHGHTADDVGLEARQAPGKRDEDLDIDASWRAKQHRVLGENIADVGDVQGREFAANQDAVEARRKIKEILGEDDDGAAMGLPSGHPMVGQRPPRSGAGLSMDDLMDGLGQGMDQISSDVARDLLQEGLIDNVPDEAALYAEQHGRRPRQTSSDWKVKKYQATLKASGRTVPVWKVVNEKTSMAMERPFRLIEVAERIAAILNQTGDMNDRRISSVIEAYNQHSVLMKKKRMLKEAIDSGRRDLRPALRAVIDQLEGVNYKLGI